MGKSVLIHQPDFMPWLGFLERWKQVDHLVILDDAQFLKRGWHHRDKIILNQEEVWFGIPIQQKGSYQKKISEIKHLEDLKWKKKFLKSLSISYGNYPGYHTYFPWFEELLANPLEYLSDMNIHILNELAGIFKITTPTSLSSTFPSEKKSTERLIELCISQGATEYITGLGSKDYLKEEKFDNQNIQVNWHQPTNNLYYPEAQKNELGLSSLHFLLKYGDPKL